MPKSVPSVSKIYYCYVPPTPLDTDHLAEDWKHTPFAVGECSAPLK